jgi:hypothetical protein
MFFGAFASLTRSRAPLAPAIAVAPFRPRVVAHFASLTRGHRYLLSL